MITKTHISFESFPLDGKIIICFSSATDEIDATFTIDEAEKLVSMIETAVDTINGAQKADAE